MLLVFFMAMWCSPFRGCWDALFILGPRNLCAVSRCWGIDRAQWWTRRRQPCCQSKVNSLSIEEGKWPPGPAHRSRKQQLKCNCFWLCLRAYRTPALCASLLFVSILILPFDASLCLRIISLGELALPSWKLETETRLHFVRGKGYRAQSCVFLALSPLHCFSVCASLHTFICAFLSWKLKALFVNAKLESNPVMTSLRLCATGWLKLPANIPKEPLFIGAWKTQRRKLLSYC